MFNLFLAKSKIIPQYYPNSFLLSNMKLVFCFELFSNVRKRKDIYNKKCLPWSPIISSGKCNTLQLEREKILAVFCQDVGLLSSAIGSQLGWHEKRNMALWSNRWVVPNFYYFWHENYRDSPDWVGRWSTELILNQCRLPL